MKVLQKRDIRSVSHATGFEQEIESHIFSQQQTHLVNWVTASVNYAQLQPTKCSISLWVGEGLHDMQVKILVTTCSSCKIVMPYMCVYMWTPGPVVGDLTKRGGPTLSLSVLAGEPQGNAKLPQPTWEREGPNLPGRTRAQHESSSESTPKHKPQPWGRSPLSGTPLFLPGFRFPP